MKALTTRPPEWTATAPITIVQTIEIDASTDDVFAALADHETWPEWFGNVKRIEVLGPAEGVGARRRVFIPGAVVDEEFVSWSPGERFGFTVTHMKPKLASSMNEDVQLADVGNGRTTVTYTMGFEPAGLGKALLPMAKKGIGAGLGTGLAALKARLEG